ncbi:retrovirus-related pol polyprotein from transposon TNT 1-94 [Tanacetum coccineum]|uniref:Retrovirus-related pol polyprotein from transposon TNT 1-94 n=1 Tax=Tanacetum coccineum TaxID=301880 RepID=A0ABQ5AYE1_9ASTR
MDTSKNVLKSDTSLFEQFQKFVDMYAKFEIFFDMLEQHKKFLALHPHAMSTSYSKELTSSFSKWILDSGATHHMSHILLQFISLSLNSLKSIMAANGKSMPLAGIGSVDTPSVSLSDVYYIPSLTMNLDSVSKICDSLGDVNFSVFDYSIYDRETHEVVGTASTRVLGDLDTHDISDCSGCKLTKFLALPFSNNISSSTALFDIVHYDMWGPSPTSCTDTPQQNGVAERKHRHLIETTISFLLPADIPSVFWGEAVLTAMYVINRIPTAHNSGLSPFKRLYGTLPDYSSLRVFGYTTSETTPESTPDTTPQTTTSTETAVDPPTSGRPKSNYKSKKWDDFVYSCYSNSFSSFLASVHRLHEPESYREAVCDPLWQVAMAEKLASWDIVPLPVGRRAISTRWVYKIKTKSDGSVERYKARLVAKCYAQEYMVWIMKRHLVQWKNDNVCKLRNALYGLKQAPWAWYEKFATVVTSLGFVSSHHDSALFVKHSSVRILLSLYVNDMIITGDDSVGIESLKLELAHHFAMKDLGLLRDLLDRARITDKMVEDIPIDAKANFTPTDGDHLPDPSLYQTLVASLVYLTVTHLDISYAVHIVSQFVSAPTTVHWAVVL